MWDLLRIWLHGVCPSCEQGDVIYDEPMHGDDGGQTLGKHTISSSTHQRYIWMSVSHYETLQVPPNASTDDIRRSYKRLVLQVHPD